MQPRESGADTRRHTFAESAADVNPLPRRGNPSKGRTCELASAAVGWRCAKEAIERGGNQFPAPHKEGFVLFPAQQNGIGRNALGNEGLGPALLHKGREIDR